MTWSEKAIEAAIKAHGMLSNPKQMRKALDAAQAVDGERGHVNMNASGNLPYSRDELGRMVREAWIAWAQTQPAPKPSWLVPYDELSEPDQEADRSIGERVARFTWIGLAARQSVDGDATWNAAIEAAVKIADDSDALCECATAIRSLKKG